ncbi:MAG: sulfotransferase [Rhodobacteraceae bacterium HLUCCA08]|nr:MAG: sulfotransferase [Rhodobacteraceae bacterium HLUCCA08]
MSLDPQQYLKSFHVAPALGLVYVNNPKVACSTIKLSLQRAELGDQGHEPRPSVHSHEGSPLLTWPDLTPARLERERAGKLLFSFVRNPFDRLRSAYLNKIARPRKHSRPREQAGFDPDHRPGFAEFVESLDGRDPAGFNPHWRPQVLNLSVDRLQFDFIGRLERFDADWASLETRVGQALPISRAGKRTGRDVSHPAEYDMRLTRIVARVYAADFARFGYSDASAP